MRIISGKYKGRHLKYPKDHPHIRPTSDRAKEALFSSLLQFINIEQTRCLDLCCATGSLGLEALSRGAKLCEFVDKNTKWVHENTQFLEEDYIITTKNIRGFLSKNTQQFDIIFFDPPWKLKELYMILNKHLAKNNPLLTPSGILIIEHHHKDIIPPFLGLTIVKTLKSSKTNFSFFKNDHY